MKQDTSMQRRRLITISLGFLFVSTFLGLRLAQKQLFEHQTYSALARGQQYQQKELTGKRGQILIKDGIGKKTYPAATNQTTYALNVVPSQVTDKRKVADSLASKTDIGADKIYEQINNTKQYIPPIKKQLSFEEKQQIEDMKLEAVFLTPEAQRFYPEDGLAAQVLGFVNAEGKGQYGIEGYYNDILGGSSGQQGTSTDANGQAVSLGGSTYTPPEDGANIVLTIDRNVQYQAEQNLAATVKKYSASGGSIIVMEPTTGSIVAMASAPTFDPNRYGSADVASYANQGISGTYEPGSTFKTIAMASGLDAGAVTPDTRINGTASIHISDKDLFNAERRPYGVQTMTQVIEHSDNVGMVLMEQKLGGPRLLDYVRKFGFGTQTGIELAGEADPQLPVTGEIDPVQYATMSYGQGITVTPIQLLTAVNSFANGGKMMQPHVVDQIQHRDGKVDVVQPKVVAQPVGPQAASQITGMMVRVVEAGAGHAAGVPGYRVAGKTGTAQIATGGAYEQNATIGNFVGFAPVQQPRFVMLVKIDRPKGVVYAEESAAPTFGAMAQFLLQYYNVPPGK